MDKKRIIIWALFILGLIGLLVLLAKLGTKPAPSSPGTALPSSVTDADWSKGSPTAKHTIVEYSDFQCPGCASFYPLLKRLVDENPSDVRIVYRFFPLRSIHTNAQKSAQAAHAAGLQGKFWEMHDALFNTQDSWGKDERPELSFEDLAVSLGLDGRKFKDDLNNPATADRVNRDFNSAQAAGLGGTPTLFFDGVLIKTPGSYDELVALIKSGK